MRWFNRVMEQLVDHHRMFKKLGEIYKLSEVAPEPVMKLAFNKWDTQLEEIIKCSEHHGCSKTYSGTYESSPIFEFWLKHVRLWRWALQHKLSPVPDPRILYRDLKAHKASQNPVKCLSNSSMHESLLLNTNWKSANNRLQNFGRTISTLGWNVPRSSMTKMPSKQLSVL
jgi:hypothetical protein